MLPPRFITIIVTVMLNIGRSICKLKVIIQHIPDNIWQGQHGNLNTPVNITGSVIAEGLISNSILCFVF